MGESYCLNLYCSSKIYVFCTTCVCRYHASSSVWFILTSVRHSLLRPLWPSPQPSLGKEVSWWRSRRRMMRASLTWHSQLPILSTFGTMLPPLLLHPGCLPTLIGTRRLTPRIWHPCYKKSWTMGGETQCSCLLAMLLSLLTRTRRQRYTTAMTDPGAKHPYSPCPIAQRQPPRELSAGIQSKL